jgi:MFS transporter, DHA1 family, tetracycline resistance protein
MVQPQETGQPQKMDQPQEKPRRAAFVFIFVTVLLDMLALGVIVPVLPKLIIHFEHGDVGLAARQVGLFGLTWAAMQFIFAPVIGSLSDRFGRRPVVLLSNFGLGLDYLLMAWAPTLRWLFLGRVISGITSASFATAGAYIADVTPKEERAAKFGLLGAAFGLGFIIGPAVGGLLGSIGLRYPFWVSAGLSLANAAYGFFILPESLSKENRAAFSLRNANPVGSLRLLRSHPELFGLAWAMFFRYLAHESLPIMFVIYTDFRYHWGERMTGLMLTVVGICSTIVSATLVKTAVKRMGELRTLFAGLLFGVVGFALYAFAPTTALFLLGTPWIALWGLSGPTLQSLMSRRVSVSEQGQLQGAVGSLFGIAGIIAPIMFTQIFAFAIAPGRSVQIPGTPYWLAALLLVGSLGLAWNATRGNVAEAVATQPAD